MPIVRPFKGLLYNPAVAGPPDTLTAPSDDMTTAERIERFCSLGPYNAAHLDVEEPAPAQDAAGGRPGGAGTEAPASRTLREWRNAGVLESSLEPSVYPYEMRFTHAGTEHRILGVVAEVVLEPWGGSIVPHEGTLVRALPGRVKSLEHLGANLSCIYGVYREPSEELARFLNRVSETPPRMEVTDESGTSHRLWVAPRGGPLVASVMADRRILIADGHHRYAAGLALRDELEVGRGPGPWDSTMMLLVDAATERPPILPIHRVVVAPSAPHGRRDAPRPDGGLLLPGITDPRVEDASRRRRVSGLTEMLSALDDDDTTVGIVGHDRGALVHEVAHLRGQPPTVILLHAGPLARMPEERLRFVPDATRAEDLVRTQAGSVAYLLPPTTVERVWAEVDSAAKMPQKSTYFWPKPRTGMVIRSFDP